MNCGMYEFMKNGPLQCNALGFYSKNYSKTEFLRQVDHLAKFLYEKGVRKGDVIAVCLPNIPNVYIAFYAINKLGAIANVIHPLMPKEGLKKILRETNSKTAFVLDIFYDKIKDALGTVTSLICSSGDYLSGFKNFFYSLSIKKLVKNIRYNDKNVHFLDAIKQGETADTVPEIMTKGADIAVYLHSGGTTGEAKTVVLNNEFFNNLSDKLSDVIAHSGKTTEKSVLVVLPMFHIFGLGVCMHAALSLGVKAVLVPQFSATFANYLMRKEKINIISGIPGMYKKLMENFLFKGKHLKSLEFCFCGGDKLGDDLADEFAKIVASVGGDCALSEGYGLTECGVCSVNTKQNNLQGSLGKPLKNTEYGIFNEQLEQIEGEGEICVSGDTLMLGYLDAKKGLDTRVIFKDAHGKQWVRTGDFGYIDEGFLFLKERIKRMIKISGINVFPSEIEEVAEECEGVDCACAVAVEVNAKTFIKLFLQIGQDADFEEVKNRVALEIKSKLMKYCMPTFFEQTTFKRTALGKIDFKELN